MRAARQTVLSQVVSHSTTQASFHWSLTTCEFLLPLISSTWSKMGWRLSPNNGQPQLENHSHHLHWHCISKNQQSDHTSVQRELEGQCLARQLRPSHRYSPRKGTISSWGLSCLFHRSQGSGPLYSANAWVCWKEKGLSSTELLVWPEVQVQWHLVIMSRRNNWTLVYHEHLAMDMDALFYTYNLVSMALGSRNDAGASAHLWAQPNPMVCSPYWVRERSSNKQIWKEISHIKS